MISPESPEITLSARGVKKSFGSRQVVAGVSLDVREGEFFALLGPSGCGKTTLLRIVAGFERPDAGTVWLKGHDVTRAAIRERDINMVFQSYALFPHLSVADNVGFGLEMMRCPRAEKRRRVDEMLALVRMERHAGSLPRQLSGGEQQRVALARALVTRPALVLLDEPLSALDAKLRHEMQLEIRRIQQTTGATFVIVTHDQLEALSMADRMAVMNEGRLVQTGTPHEIYERPRNRFVASFIGEANFLPKSMAGDAGEGEQFLLRPEQMRVLPPSANGLAAVVADATFLGRETRLRLRVSPEMDLVALLQGQSPFQPGDSVKLAWTPAELHPLSEDEA